MVEIKVLLLALYVIAYVIVFNYFYLLRTHIRCDYPLNLSISVSGGKETKKDSLSNCE
jgi:hypothetical protein